MSLAQLTRIGKRGAKGIANLRAVNAELEQLLRDMGKEVPPAPGTQSSTVPAPNARAHMRCTTCDTRYTSASNTCPHCHATGRAVMSTDTPPDDYAIAWYKD